MPIHVAGGYANVLYKKNMEDYGRRVGRRTKNPRKSRPVPPSGIFGSSLEHNYNREQGSNRRGTPGCLRLA